MTAFLNAALLATEAVGHRSTIVAHHPFLPETKEMLYGIPSFVLVVGLLVWKAGPAMKKGLAKRGAGIVAAFAGASQRKTDAEMKLNELTSSIGSSSADATKIIEDAKATAAALKVQATKDSAADIEALRVRAAIELTSQTSQAEVDLRNEISEQAVARAEIVAQQNLSADTQQALIGSFIAGVTR